MSELTLVKSAKFGEIDADIYSNGDEMFMTIGQLAACLEYTKRQGIEMLMSRNPYLKDEEFSVTNNLLATDGKCYETRVFTEDGIYEITMLSKQPKAQEFRRFIRKLLKSLRRGELMLTNGAATATPTLTKTQIEQYFTPVLESHLNYQAAWLTAQFNKRISALEKTIGSITTVIPEEYPRPVGYLLKGCPDDMDWKQWVYRLLDCYIVMADSKHSRRDLLSTLYRYMLKHYTYVSDEECKKYRKRHPDIDGKIPIIELIADDPKWRSIFSSVLVDFVSNKGEGFEIPAYKPRAKASRAVTIQAPVVVAAPIEATAKPVEAPAKPIEVTAKPTDAPAEQSEISPEKHVQKWRTRRDKIVEYLRPMAEARKDRSKGFNVTFRMVYSKMQVDWDAEIVKYHKKYGTRRKYTNKIDVIADSPRLRKIFIAAVKESMK